MSSCPISLTLHNTEPTTLYLPILLALVFVFVVISRLEHGMSYSYYMLLYTACYNYCISSNKSHEIPGYGSTPIGSSGTVKGESPSVRNLSWSRVRVHQNARWGWNADELVW